MQKKPVKVVLTGGPCAGKSTVLESLVKSYGNKIVVVPEVATILLNGGWPLSGKHLPWNPEWQSIFQSAIIKIQPLIENAWGLAAENQNSKLIICDRGLLDGAAYTPGGISAFCQKFQLNLIPALTRYDLIIHLESLATAQPELYQSKIDNQSRFETLERAQQLEVTTHSAWDNHPNRQCLHGQRTLEQQIEHVRKILEPLL